MKYVHKLISEESSKDIEEMIKKINEIFGVEVSGVQASKIISWKYRNPLNNQITSVKKLIEILGGKNVRIKKIK